MSCELHTFPAERHVRPWLKPGALPAQVAVTCRGETRIFDREQDLHAAVLVANCDQLAASERTVARLRILRRQLRIATWRRRRWARAVETARTIAAFSILAGVVAAMAFTLMGGLIEAWL